MLDGLEGGGFAKARPVLDKDGDVLRVGQYWDDEARKWTGMEKTRHKQHLGISATPVDWDADGDLDLLLGANGGRMFVRLNEGSATEPVYAAESLEVEANGDVLEVENGHAMPVVADWDGDGLFDIVSGSDHGAVFWWRNVGEQGAPAFDLGARLVPDAERAGEGDRPGQRTQVHVCDFDADGDLDLLVGDFHSRRLESSDQTYTAEYHGWVWLYRNRASIGAAPPGK